MAYSGAFRMNSPEEESVQPVEPAAHEKRPPQRQDKLSGAVEALMRKLDPSQMETDDLIMALILYLL